MYPPFYGYPYPPMNGNAAHSMDIREIRKAQKKYLKDMQKMEEGLKAKAKTDTDKKKDDGKPKPKSFTTFEVFMMLTLFSPIIGPLYTWLIISGAKNILAQISTLMK